MRFLQSATLALVSAATLAAAPVISGVYNAASWAPPALPNSGVAQGAIFTLKGSGLGPATLQQVTAYPLPTTAGLAGTSVTVTVNGVTETCIMIYTVSGQVAAILPSATPIGTGTLTVNYQGAEGSIPIQVVPANLGTFTLNEAGSGPGVFTDTSYSPITMINPAYPGQTLILWGTGLGAIAGNETEPPQQVDLGTGAQVQVGNQPATVLYAGRGSSPGLDQINFVVPANVTGCRTSVAVTVKGTTGNVTSIAIAPQGQPTCGDTYGFLTGTNLQTAISRGSINFAGVQVSRLDGNDTLAADFYTYPLNSLIRSYGGSFGASMNSCSAYEIYGTELVLADPVQPTFLNAGVSLALAGPNGTKTVAPSQTGHYDAEFGTASSPAYITPGAYSISNGSGSSAVGPFTWSTILPASIAATLPTRVNRSQDLTLTWSGGSLFSVVTILMYNGVAATSPNDSFVELICTANASAGSFTIPSALLNLLPANGFGLPGIPGVNIQIGGDIIDHFTASGIDSANVSAFITQGGVVPIQ
jgi:uncharacterized protein (TIGR03437 family)